MKIELIGEVADYYGEQKPDLAPLPKKGVVLSATEDELQAVRFPQMQGGVTLVPAETPVDNSACRSALDEIQEKISAWRNDGTLEHWQYSQLWDIADFALAAPARNCDVGTAKEQARRWEEFCTHHHKKMIGNKIPVGPCECPCYEGNSCNHFIWAQMPYNESEATYD